MVRRLVSGAPCRLMAFEVGHFDRSSREGVFAFVISISLTASSDIGQIDDLYRCISYTYVVTTRLTELNLNLLHALDALLEEGNVTQAARRVGISQPAMSQNLATLRKVFGDELLVRTGAGMERTVRALAIAPGLRSCLGELQRVINTGGSFEPSTAEGAMHVATGDHLAAALSTRLLGLLKEQAPHVVLRVDSLNMAECYASLQNARFELALGPAGACPAGIRSEALFTDEFVCFVRAGHPVVKGREISLRRYASLEHLLISPSGRGRSFVDTALAERGLSRKVVGRIASFLMGPHIVASSDVVLTGPRTGLSTIAKSLNVRVLPAPLALPGLKFAMLWDARRQDDPRHVWMRQVFRQALQRLRTDSTA